jgi:hypothetical protein
VSLFSNSSILSLKTDLKMVVTIPFNITLFQFFNLVIMLVFNCVQR